MLLFTRTRIRIGAALAGVAVLSVAMLPGAAVAEVPSSQVPAELKAAIEQYIEGRGHDYVGFCRDVNENPGSIVPGTYCAFVNSIEHEIAEVTYGPVLSDAISRVSFKLEGGEWKVMTQATPTATATTPVPGPSEVPSSQVPAELKAAIKQYIEGQAHDYVGFCRDVNANPGSIVPGTYCAAVASIEHEIAEVAFGPVLSDEISRVSFKLENGQWKVMTQATPTATTTPSRTATAVTTPRAPATGSGANPDSDGEGNPTIILTVAFATAAGLGAIATIAARRR